MESIKGVEKIERALGRWSPEDLAGIESLELKTRRDQQGANLILCALFQPRAKSWPDFDKRMFRVSILFEKVKGLSLKNFGGGPNQIMGFDILFVGDRGMEGINYEIIDYEDDRIRFSCSSVCIESVDDDIN